MQPSGLLAVLLLISLSACQRAQLDSSVARRTQIDVQELAPPPGTLALPLKNGSVRLAIIGDSGRGDRAQNEVAQQLVFWRERFPFDTVLMLGDNIYPPHSPDDYVTKFERPYAPLLAAGVKFYAAIGNHDPDGELNYAGFNMRGERYYTFRLTERGLTALTGGGVRFFALDSRSLDPAQLSWLRDRLAESGSVWKICFFHHPLYTSGRYGALASALRAAIEPILVEGDVDVVLSGHEHFYERVVPQHGIAYFISGAAGSLRRGDIRRSPLRARGFDTDNHFMLMEIAGRELYFQAISRTGDTVDAGVLRKR
jgi:hypothetical protein